MAESKRAAASARAGGAEEKAKALETALAQIKKQFGEGAVMRLGQDSALNVEAIPTGSLSLDLALGIGGVPRGRIIEIYGPESSGKTTLALHCIAEGQKRGGNAAFIDVEHALDPVYAGNLGVDVDSLLVSQPDTGEQALEITEALVRSNAIDVIVVDSVAALVPRAEIEGEMGDSHVGLQARLMSQALRKLAGAISKSNCVAIFINQLREKVGVIYGNPEVTPGGRALKFYSSVRIEVRKAEVIKSGADIIGSRTRAKVVKNKLAPPFRTAEFDVMYGTGISRTGELLDIAVKLEIVQKAGAWFSYNGERIGQGRDNSKEFLANHPEMASEIEQLEKDIADLNDVLAKPARVRRIIINELNEVAKKYAQPRRSEILYDLPEEEAAAEEETVPDYPVTVFFTREGYLKKIPPQSLRTAGAHKLKEGDEIVQQVETRNNVEALFFTDKQQVYKVRLAELEDGKVAQMGIFVPGRLGMDEGENILAMVITGDYSGFVLFFFASGKCAKIPLSSYATKQNRRKLLKAYCDKEPLAKLLYLPEETELAIRTSASRMLLVGTAQIAAKATRDSQGVAVVTLKKNQTIASVVPADTLELANPHRYRVRSLPATGALIRAEDEGEQMSLL